MQLQNISFIPDVWLTASVWLHQGVQVGLSDGQRDLQESTAKSTERRENP